MMRKHAIVIALSFVLVGMMFFSVDTPLIQNQEVNTQIVTSQPQEVQQIADEPVPEEPLRLNVIENPSFESMDSTTNYPEGWYAQTSTYQHADPGYSGVVGTGNYAGLAEAQGSSVSYASSYLSCYPIGHTTTTLLELGISLSFNWNTLTNPDIVLGSEVFFYLQTDNGFGTAYNFYYHLSTGLTGRTNQSTTAFFELNDTLNQWNDFDRNITEDFIAVFGSGALTSTSYVTNLWFYASSPSGATDKVQAVFDDVVLYNSTYSGWIEDGDFETGSGDAWVWYNSSPGYVTQSTDSTLDTYSLNMSIPTMPIGSANARTFTTFPSYYGYHALYPRMNTIELDWKYNDTVGAGLAQYAYLRLRFSNGSTYSIHFYFGKGNDIITSSNTTINYYIKMPGFGSRNVWQHSEVDIYEVCSALGLYNLTMTEISLYIYQAQIDAGVELLVDDFKMMTYPASDPSFEYDNIAANEPPFMGWDRLSNTPGVVTKSSDSLRGAYACNITTVDQTDGINRQTLYVDIDSALATDFWWRLDEISDGQNAAYVQLMFSESGDFRNIRYILGKSVVFPISNTSTFKTILADGFNQTGMWTNFARNLTADIENYFETSADDWSLYGIEFGAYSGSGVRTSFLVDDVHFTDTVAPSITLVAHSASSVYYSPTFVTVTATDIRPGISSVVINYTIDGWSSWNTITADYVAGDYDAYIPAQPYDTYVQFYAIATDGVGLQTINDNGGAFYSYTVGDDVAPTLTIDTPVNNTDVQGLLAITATADDAGSGVEYVSFNIDSSGPVSDYTTPYSQNWNLDDESLGSHYIIVTVRDNAGRTVSKTHYITVVDTILPELDSPSDVVFTVDVTGHAIDWNPTDIRPESYEVFVDTVSTYTGLWNSSSEHLVIDLDDLAVGTYNYTCVVYDDAGNSAVDTVIVTVNAETTTTIVGEGILTPLLIVAGIGVVGLLLVVFVVLPKMKKT